MGNLDLYERVREVQENAKKPITGGRLKGMTDINPMWRIKKLTEEFGMVGIGWFYEITKKEIIPGDVESIAVVDINLYIKVDGEWSKPIVGTGGSTFVSKERSGLYTDDECFKKALTDAISVACKALGIGADVYWQSDRTKYTQPEEKKPGNAKDNPQEPKQDTKQYIARSGVTALERMCTAKGVAIEALCKLYKVDNLAQLTIYQYKNINDHWQEIIDMQR